MNEKLKMIIAEQLGHDVDMVNPDVSIVDDLGADSLDVVELTMAIEEEFDTEISDEVAESMKTVGDIEKELVKRKLIEG